MWNARWQREGQEPDYRFTLANERTFLAWIRTALAILAGSVLLEQFATRLQPHWLLTAVAVVLAAVSAALCSMAYWRWRANEIAMRQARPLPAASSVPVLAAVLCLMSGVIAVLLLPR
jgi:putative membrane protein